MGEILGYANASMISAICAGNSFPDIDKLVALGRYRNADGRYPNLDWLLTGRGAAFLPRKEGTAATNRVANVLSSADTRTLKAIDHLLAKRG